MDENTVMPTSATEVIDSFEASFQDKSIIPLELELLWLKKAVAQYSAEIEELTLEAIEPEASEDNDEQQDGDGEKSMVYVFTESIGQYAIDTLAQMMKVYYMEREVSKVNKRVSIVSKDISIDGNNGSKTAAKNELDYNVVKATVMAANQKPPAYN